MLTHCGTQTIQTERLVLRQFAYSDNESMGKHWVSDPYIQKMYSEPTYTTYEEIEGLLTKYIDSYQKEDYYRWAITEKGNADCIGQIAYFMTDSKNHFGEIEYCTGSAFQKKGYMTEAVGGILEYGFEKINLHKVQVCHKAGNEGSRRVIEKSGFVYEGTLRDYFYMDGEYTHRLYYSMLRSEWEER